MSEAFRKELQKFDVKRAMAAWDGLISKQQTELECLGVPSMYPTSEVAEREVCTCVLQRSGVWTASDIRVRMQRQQRVAQVLAGISME